MKKEIFRIIDANFNRSREGLRVCEDIARFALNSPVLSGDLKSIRHSISGIVKTKIADRCPLYESRDSRGDIGALARLPSEMKRVDLVDIFTANMERAKESLRVLEEIFKLVDKDFSVKFTALRFKAYDVERKAVKRISSLRK